MCAVCLEYNDNGHVCCLTCKWRFPTQREFIQHRSRGRCAANTARCEYCRGVIPPGQSDDHQCPQCDRCGTFFTSQKQVRMHKDSGDCRGMIGVNVSVAQSILELPDGQASTSASKLSMLCPGPDSIRCSCAEEGPCTRKCMSRLPTEEEMEGLSEADARQIAFWAKGYSEGCCRVASTSRASFSCAIPVLVCVTPHAHVTLSQCAS
jgi:hypothetical protein